MLLLTAAILLLPMLQMSAVVGRSPASVSRERVAIDLAQAAIDRFQQMPWESIRSSPRDGFDQARDGIVPAFARLPAAAGDSVTVDGTEYHLLWYVAADPDLPNLKTVTVLSCWRQGGSRWGHAVLVTQFADVGR